MNEKNNPLDVYLQAKKEHANSRDAVALSSIEASGDSVNITEHGIQNVKRVEMTGTGLYRVTLGWVPSTMGLGEQFIGGRNLTNETGYNPLEKFIEAALNELLPEILAKAISLSKEDLEAKRLEAREFVESLRTELLEEARSSDEDEPDDKGLCNIIWKE